MAYTFARVGAALSMNVGDYYPEGKQWSVRLREKGGKRKQIAVHHVLEEYMDAYLAAAGLSERQGHSPLPHGPRQDRHAHREPHDPTGCVEHAPAPRQEGRDHDGDL